MIAPTKTIDEILDKCIFELADRILPNNKCWYGYELDHCPYEASWRDVIYCKAKAARDPEIQLEYDIWLRE